MRAHLILLGLMATASAGCDSYHQPSSINLRVSVSTIGVDRDSSYTIHAGDSQAHLIGSGLSMFLSPGEHDVALDGVAANCSVQGPGSVRVTITPGDVVSVGFEVACHAVTGAIAVTAPTTGRDFDTDGYTVHLDDVLATRVFPGALVVIEGVQPGSHVVRLDDISANCRLSGSPTQTAVVTAGGLTRDTVYTLFDGSCDAATGDVQILTATQGVERDPNGYTITADGELVIEPCGWYDYSCQPGAPLLLPPTGSRMLLSGSTGEHTYRIGDIAPNCTALEGDTRTVSVVLGEISTVRFDITCEAP